MIYNCTKTTVVLGRFTLLPGAKVPAVSLTDKEAAAVTRLVQAGVLEDDGHSNRPAQPAQPVPAPAPAQAPATAPADPASGKSSTAATPSDDGTQSTSSKKKTSGK